MFFPSSGLSLYDFWRVYHQIDAETIVLPFLDRPYMGSFSRPRHSPVSLGMTARCFSVNILSVAMWELVRVLLEVYSTEVRECLILLCGGIEWFGLC